MKLPTQSIQTCALLLTLLLVSGCVSMTETEPYSDTELPTIEPVELQNDQRLQVVATTNIVADIVTQVGGTRIELTNLIPVGADPHSFQATPQDLIALNDSHIIFVNGLHLEEAVAPVLQTLDRGGPIVSVNVGVEILEGGHDEDHHGDGKEDEHADGNEDDHGDEGEHSDEDEHGDEGDHGDEDEHGDHHDEHNHAGGDPHTWFQIDAIKQWVANIEQTLSQIDPSGADLYTANATEYLAQLETLQDEIDALIAPLSVDQRLLITDHDVLGYFAADYDFRVVGSVIPSLSTAASTSAGELAELQEQIISENGQAIFVGVSANPDLSNQIAADLGIQVVPIYTDSLSGPDGPASSYIEFMRYNATAIVEALE